MIVQRNKKEMRTLHISSPYSLSPLNLSNRNSNGVSFKPKSPMMSKSSSCLSFSPFKKSKTISIDAIGNRTASTFRKSINIMGNSKESHEAFFNEFDKRLKKMDEVIQKEKDRALYSVFTGENMKNEREKILSLFMDYFEPKKYIQIRDRYNSLLGKDSYLRRIKMIKSKSFSSLYIKKKPKEEDKSKEEEIKEKKLQIQNNIKPIIIPENYQFFEPLNLDVFYSKNRYVIENINMIYSSPTRRDKQFDKMSHCYENNDEQLLTPVLKSIDRETDKVENIGNKLKRKIVRMRKKILMREPIKKKSDEEAFYDADTLPPRELKVLNKKKLKIRKKQVKLM